MAAIVVTSKIKAHIKKAKMNTAGDLIPALDREISEIVTKACTRARANGRKTVRAADL